MFDKGIVVSLAKHGGQIGQKNIRCILSFIGSPAHTDHDFGGGVVIPFVTLLVSNQ